MMDKKIRSLIDWFSLLTVFGGLAMSVVVAYWLLFPYNPLVINGHAKVLQKETKAGGVVIYQLDYCKNMHLPVTVKRRFVDGLVYTLPEFSTNSNDVGCRVQNVLLDVPRNLPSGTYKFGTEFVYQVNPIRKVTVSVESNSFKVIE